MNPRCRLLLSVLAGALPAGCSTDEAVAPVAAPSEPAVVVSETLTRAAAVLEIGGRKVEVQKIYVQHRLIFAATPSVGKSFELLDNNVLLIGRIEVRLGRIGPGVYRLDGDGSLVKVADGQAAALMAWNDESAWLAPRPAKFLPGGVL